MKLRLLSLALLVAACAGVGTVRPTLGVRTSAPSPEQAEQLGLEFDVRWKGRLVEDVVPGSAADAAGIKPGDVLLAIDGITLFSQDDIDDFLAVSTPGQGVPVRVKPSGESETHEVRVTLGRGEPSAADEPQLEWQYASLAQLPRALEQARARKKKVMVGLSGAET